MPEFNITAPDGKNFRVTAPEGATQEQALERVKAQYAAQPQQPESLLGRAAEVGKGALDFGKGLGVGVAKGTEAFPGAMASLMGMAGRGAESLGLGNQEEAAKREQFRTENPLPMATGGLHAPETPAGKYGESIGELVPGAVVSPGSTLSRTAMTVGGGIGAEAGGQLTESPWGRLLGGFIGGVAGGAPVMAHEAAQASKLLPSLAKIKESGTQSYEAIKAARLRIEPNAVKQLGTKLLGDMDRDLIVESGAPSSFRAITQLENSGGDIAQFMDTYSALGKIPPTAGADYVAAQKIRAEIGSFIDKIKPSEIVSGDPQLTKALWDHGKAQWRAYRELDLIQKGRELAEHRAGSTGTGFNTINTLRQETRKILDNEKKSRGFSDEAKQQMERIVEGTWATNAARYASKFAPSGTVSGMFTVLAHLAVGLGPASAVAGGALLAKYLGVYLTKRQIRDLEDLIRMEAPTGRAMADQYRAKAPNRDALLPLAGARSTMAVPDARGASDAQSVLDGSR